MILRTALGYVWNIISSHDYDVAKEKQEFWQKLEDEIKFDKAKSIFFDDSPSVLESAKQYGIGTVVAISKPSSKVNNQSLQDMFKSFDIDKAFNFFGVHFRAGLADSNDCANAILLGRF
jgi:FMN phosphatase YigB (HAD superfamily)